MWKKIVAIFVLLSAALWGTLCWLLSNTQLERIANHFLAPNFSIEMAENIHVAAKGADIPSLALISNQTPSCTAVRLHHLRTDWWDQHKIRIEKAVIDYACLSTLPQQETTSPKTELNLTALLALLPDGEAEIGELQLINGEQLGNDELQQLLQSHANLKLEKQESRLRLVGALQQQDKIIAQFDSNLINHLINGTVTYHLADKGQYHLDFQLHLNEDLTQLPPKGTLNLNWQHESFVVPQGHLSAQWQEQQGHIMLQDMNRQIELFNLPFNINQDQIQIEKGGFYWDLGEGQPLRGVLNLSVKKTQQEWFPLKTDVRVSLFSEGAQGKGNVVIYGSNGEIGQDGIDIPLEAHGNFKYGASIAYIDTVFKLSGIYAEPVVYFQNPSNLRVTGRGTDLNLNINIPLADVQISRYGVEGRLQAQLKGDTPQFSGLELNLDGQAHEFIAGIKSIFDIRDTKNHLKNTEAVVANHWEWTLSGKGMAKAVKAPVSLQGKGYWTNNHIEIQQLEGRLGEVNKAGVNIPTVELKLTDNIRWYYEEEKIRGMLEATAPFIGLSYGGRFERPVFGLSLEGSSVADFNLAGELRAGELGPIKIFAHYYEQKLVGNIYWLEQPADVFQSLFPHKWDWLIRQGTIRGQTAFDITESEGIRAGGHFAIRGGEIALPDGEIEGIEFALPYRYIDNQTQLTKHPVEVFVKRLKNGSLQLDNLRVKVRGYFPYSRKFPLELSQLSVDILGGQLSIDKLAFPQQNAAQLHLREIDLEQVIDLLQYNQLKMRGRINGMFPFWLEGKTCIVCDGNLSQAENVNLKLSEEMQSGLKQGGITESILVNVISEMDLQELQAKVNLKPNGIMQLNATIKGYNPNKKTAHPITLNYNHRENVYELWDIIDYGSQFEQKLEYDLYRQLEKR